MKMYYLILGITENASEKEIKSAFLNKINAIKEERNKSEKIRPEDITDIIESYFVLNNPSLKKSYDKIIQGIKISVIDKNMFLENQIKLKIKARRICKKLLDEKKGAEEMDDFMWNLGQTFNLINFIN